jgi:hypothetical protein
MLPTPGVVPRTAVADCQITDVPFICIPMHAVTTFMVMDSAWVPLSQRQSDELRAKADELRRMAATASTPDVAKALLALADRYAALAEARRARSEFQLLKDWPPA